MLRRHKGAFLTRGVNRSLHDTLGAPRIVGRLLRGQDILKTVPFPNHLLRTVVVYTALIQCLGCSRVTHVQNPKQELTGTDVPLAAPLRNIL